MKTHVMTLELSIYDDGDITVGVLLRRKQTLRWAEVAHLREPYSPAGAARAAHALTMAFFTPELGSDADDVFAHTFHALTTPF